MWRRNSLSFSSKLLTSSNPNSRSTFLSSAISSANYAFQRSLSHSTLPTDDLKLGFPKLDPIQPSRFASSAAAIDVATRARDVVDVARHYGRCYWELSKARLRKPKKLETTKVADGFKNHDMRLNCRRISGVDVWMMMCSFVRTLMVRRKIEMKREGKGKEESEGNLTLELKFFGKI